MLTSRKFFPSLSSLRALEALDRLGSASAVAEELALTQSAVSRQLQTLEGQMGVELIRRDRKRLSLTPAAQDYVTEIREALNRIAQASLRLQVAPAGGTVNLAILPTFGMRWLMPRLPEFSRLHPDITINMTTRLRPFNFASEPFDAALHFGEPDWPGTDRLLLRAERVLPVCAPGLLPHGAPKSPADLLRLPLLHIQTRPRAWQDWFAQMGVTCPETLPGTLYDQFATIGQAALHGLGVALLPNYVVEQDLATGRLVAAYPDAVETLGAYYLVWPRARGNDPSLRAFRHWLAAQAEPEEGLPR
ncbi:LysR family transcriptional regulator [Ruegeria pomeroyi]|uniref:Transcriptional regulator, LysR family n=2 Tax=Ruegeria pomeroyi TaxID=89184 RepID=Q5LS16_RUEPO|nr:LysR substrate-binding domain-containing protein [Ruegeria pomeroyi]AAV95230.1 transcriptional regulator, LysR family [Ruegeria pomeroyi DSS-3]NVK97418.1 LysR family transcriptional regulator [Ruegeria pomeroyi]NVL01640.1 LysR family transcriptional regulator [Ruegeria pomeroyi]QWV08804.1 LysR family transcriptional regulator [Ruegeria pomeroyi]